MFLKFWLAIKGFPGWVAAAKRRNPWLYAEFVVTCTILAGIVLTFFSFRADALYLVFLVAIPGLWTLFQPFLARRFAAGGKPFGAGAAVAFPVLAMTIADLLAMPAILYGKDAFGPGSYAELYLLAIATVLRIGMHMVMKRTSFRGKPVVDFLFVLLSYAFAVILYSLSISA